MVPQVIAKPFIIIIIVIHLPDTQLFTHRTQVNWFSAQAPPLPSYVHNHTAASATGR